MHPHLWIEALFGSRAKVRILRVLSGDPARVWTERELAKAVHMSPNTVNAAIGQLRDAGILDFHRIGRTHAIRLRSDLAVVDHIKLVFLAEAGTWDTIARRIEKVMPPGVACYLYGSTARRSSTPASDIDVLVVAETEPKASEAAALVMQAASTVFPTGFEVIAMGVRELRKKKGSAFIRNVLTEGHQIGPTSLEELT